MDTCYIVQQMRYKGGKSNFDELIFDTNEKRKQQRNPSQKKDYFSNLNNYL